jgi:hypothetical protein
VGQPTKSVTQAKWRRAEENLGKAELRAGGTVRAVGLKIQVTFDCRDADQMATFWALALDYTLQPPPDGFDTWETFLDANDIPHPDPGSIAAVIDPDGTGPRMLFLRVPEGKVAKNRVHLDIEVIEDGAKLAKVRQLVEAGATEVGRVDEHDGWWVVMLDPEGNEFCVV